MKIALINYSCSSSCECYLFFSLALLLHMLDAMRMWGLKQHWKQLGYGTSPVGQGKKVTLKAKGLQCLTTNDIPWRRCFFHAVFRNNSENVRCAALLGKNWDAGFYRAICLQSQKCAVEYVGRHYTLALLYCCYYCYYYYYYSHYKCC